MIASLLNFLASGGMGPTAKVVYKKLASMIVIKHDHSEAIARLLTGSAVGSASLCFAL